ncbi:hypothetical protein T02_710 [Trichinella nativa]|uniref:Uncharacterized protein n=1 Tax=Trichinella nativa TaxID=6335 RepID=A0A0V1KLC1_9BILA|nr:hypothetical protein T02_710 [Trichinella nativa]
MVKLIHRKNAHLRWLRSALDDLRAALDSDRNHRQSCLMRVSEKWTKYDRVVEQLLGIQIKEDPETKEIERSTPSNVRLPKLEIRKYHGDPHDWQRFQEEFSPGDHNKCKRTRRVKFWISSLNGKDDEKQLVEALCLSKICQKPKLVPNVHRLKHLTALQLADDFTGNSGAFDVLIGLDYHYEFVDHKIKRGKKGEPVAVHSTLGWIICGPMTNEKEDPTFFSQSVKVLYAKVDGQLDEAIRKFWEIETIGMMDDSDKADVDSTRAVQNFESTLQFDGIRYTVRLPWLKDDAQLPSNYHQALSRLQQIKRSLKNDPRKAAHYKKGMREYLEEDFVEEVTDRTGYPGRIWYLPHHAVIREDKITIKCRIVFDGSAQYRGVALHQHLDVGPALQNNLLKVLLRFRRFPIGFQADISKMFLQIGLNEQDRDVCRFLWRSHDVQKAPRIYRFKTGIAKLFFIIDSL